VLCGDVKAAVSDLTGKVRGCASGMRRAWPEGLKRSGTRSSPALRGTLAAHGRGRSFYVLVYKLSPFVNTRF